VADKTGGPAFPDPIRADPSVVPCPEGSSGMTLREWVIAISRRHAERGYEDETAAVEANRLGLIQADAMLKAREAKS